MPVRATRRANDGGATGEVIVANASRRERLRYWFDSTMSRGTPALVAWLGLASVVLIGVVSGLSMLLAPADTQDDMRRVLWMSLLRTLDPGTMGGDQGHPVFLALMLTVTIGGIFIVSALVGVLAAGLDERLRELRKGRSRLIEENHTVVLGWSDQVFTIIAELIAAQDGANDRHRGRPWRACVAILAEQDKVTMEDAIRARVRGRHRVRIICRHGNPTDPTDLAIVRPDRASSIIVLAPQDVDAEADIRVMKSLLALSNRDWPEKRPPVVAAVADSHNLPAAVLAGGPSAQVVNAKDIIARLVVQSRRQPGLSAVWTELLSFVGDEIYLTSEPDLVGMRYGDALFAFTTSALFGIRHANGVVELNPPMDTRIVDSDELIVVATNASSTHLAGSRPSIVESAVSRVQARRPKPDSTLILGWNAYGSTILELLNRYLPAQSDVEVAASRPRAQIEAGLTEAGLTAQARLRVRITTCATTDRPALDALDLKEFQHVLVLADDDVDPAHADSRTLVTLLHLRDRKENHGDRYAIVSELNDDANRRLAHVTRTDDFIIGKKLITLYLTQLSQNPNLKTIFAELFDAKGSDIYLRPADEYITPGVPANFATVVHAARLRQETAIGYRLAHRTYEPPGYGVVLNPDKSLPLILAPEDRVVVLARV
jgi:voltage-gated potassium channel Kch